MWRACTFSTQSAIAAQCPFTFCQTKKVAVDLFVSIDLGYTVPSQVATLQEKVKNQIEGATKFKVQSVNVQVVNVNVAQ